MRYMLKNPFLTSHLGNVVEPDNPCIVSSTLWGLCVFADYGFIKIFWVQVLGLRFPLSLRTYISELIQGVSSICGVMILCTVISLSCTGGTLGLSVMSYLLGILPILKESANMF